MSLRPRVITPRDLAVVVASKTARDVPVPSPDRYLSKLVKYIPVEIVAAYLAGEGVIEGMASPPSPNVLWIWWGFLVVLSPFWIAFATRTPGLPVAWFQTLVAPVAFTAWVFGMGGPFAATWSYSPAYGSLVLIAATLLIPLLEGVIGHAAARRGGA
jgi:hypothetical protein